MIEDMLTVMWKEQKGLLRLQGSRTRTLLVLLVVIVMLGVVLPIQMGREYLTGAWSLIAVFLVPLFLVGMVVPESFAGERERHTLETLLASRLPDRAILFGKLVLAVAYGWGAVLLILLVGLVIANVIEWNGQLSFYKPAVVLVDVVLSLLMSGLIASLGILISLRASSVQGAAQALMFGFMIPLFVIQVIPMLFVSVVPNGEAIVKQVLSTDIRWVGLGLAGILAVSDIALLLAAMARFQRARLSLD
jgi:ABC-2 type transport system permease protein